jgi:ankyrin repeat protein
LAQPKPWLVLFAALLLGTGPGETRADDLAGDLAAALAAAQKSIRLQEFSKAADIYRRAADAGSGEAQYQLGTLYLLGRGVSKNETRAQELFEQAADQNHAAAQFALAQLLRDKSPERAAQLIEAAAQLGYAPALAQLDRSATAAPSVNQEAPLDAQWFGAARTDQTALLQTLLAQHNNINLTDSAGRTALFYAVEADSTSAVRWLIDRGVDVRHKDSFGLTAAQRALERRRPELLLLLLKAGADKNQVLANGDNLLHYAIRLKEYELADPLIQVGVAINKSNGEGWTPLDLAQYQGATQTAALLTRHGGKNGAGWRSDRRAQDVQRVAEQLNNGEVPGVAKAVINNNRPLLEQMLGKDPKLVHTTLDDGSTLLVLAIKHNKPEMVSTLIKRGADVNQKAYRGVTALQVAVQEGDPAIVKQLLDAGASVGLADDSGRDALITALEEEKYKIAEMLLDDVMGEASGVASIKAHMALNKVPVDRYILLATQHHTDAVLSKLLPYASSGGALDDQQRNALWFAAAESNSKLIPQLLQAGVSAEQADTLGRTPFLMAVDKACLECARALLPKSNINHQSSSGNSALMLAAANKDALFTTWLLQNKADVELRNQRGDTALMVAVSANTPDVVRHLLKANASTSRKNRLGFSALDLAKQVSPQMVELVKSNSVFGVF